LNLRTVFVTSESIDRQPGFLQWRGVSFAPQFAFAGFFFLIGSFFLAGFVAFFARFLYFRFAGFLTDFVFAVISQPSFLLFIL
jgi:hypothetical protein